MMMLSVQDAETLILDLIHPLNTTETLPLEAANQRILAQSVISPLDFPYWDNSAMDGYAVRFADVAGCSERNPAILKIITEIPAGIAPKDLIQTGETARIFTGAMLPSGADTIIMQENTQRDGDRVKILIPPEAKYAFVRKKGDYYQAGNPLLSSGIKINAPEMAVLATASCSEVTVYRRPRVAILSTGDELIAPDQPLQPGQIIDSNQYALGAFVEKQGSIPIKMGIVPDNRQLLREKMAEAIASADIVLSTGGVSVGDYDYVETLLEELGGEIYIRSVAIKPGKPLTVAKFDNGCLYFGIPGNPVSALVSCWRFVQPALKKLSGLQDNWTPEWIKVRSRQNLHSGGQRETYLWGRLILVEGEYGFELAGGSHSSGNLINLAHTDALAVLRIGQTLVSSGDWVEVSRCF